MNYTFSRLEQVAVDGNVEEWENHLNALEDLWSFGVAERNNVLFVAIVIKDIQLQREALSGGIFVNISYNDKRKDGARLYFPYWDRERKKALSASEELRQTENFEQALLEKVNGYYLQGFGRVRDGLLALDNDYGIRATTLVDSNKNLVYEARIPLELVGLKSDVVAVQVGVRTQYAMMKKAMESSNRPTNGGYGYGYPVMGGPSLKNPYKAETEIWIVDKVEKSN
ncbi:hypothetical protein [Sphingobacterium sp. T2]|uniref:hypothetical protein n=1 Tax=Sphingobacterium sp. T2 TaxID=1590596 RepID=UPI0012E08042|nr:hypothetical protein [Sphingobacterium sp. T2]